MRTGSGRVVQTLCRCRSGFEFPTPLSVPLPDAVAKLFSSTGCMPRPARIVLRRSIGGRRPVPFFLKTIFSMNVLARTRACAYTCMRARVFLVINRLKKVSIKKKCLFPLALQLLGDIHSNSKPELLKLKTRTSATQNPNHGNSKPERGPVSATQNPNRLPGCPQSIHRFIHRRPAADDFRPDRVPSASFGF